MRPRLHLTGRPKITIGEQTLSVPAKGFAMLAVLAGSADGVKSRAELRSMYGGLRGQLAQASEKRNKVALKELSTQLVGLADQFRDLGDPEYEAYCLVIVANALKDNDQQLDAVKLYDRADQVFTRAGYQNHSYHGQVKAIRDSLKNEGYDPDAKPGESTAPAGNTSTSWAKDAEGKRYSDPIPMRLHVDEKLPTKFVTPSARSSGNTARWRQWVLNGNGPAAFSGDFNPLSTKFKVKRDGVKLAYQLDGSDDWEEFKCIAKPNLVEMERKVSTTNGEVELEYAWLAASGGSQESRFGMSINASPQMDQIGVRYHSACYLKGKVLGEDLILIDDNNSGTFGDRPELIDNTSTVAPHFVATDAMIVGRAKVAAPFTEFMESNGAFYRIKVQEDYSIRTRKLDVDTAKVKLKYEGRVKPQIVVIEERREFIGAFFPIEERNWTTVPVGEYRLSYGIIRKGKGNNEQSCTILPGRTTSFRVEKDQEHVVELGGPYTFDFEHEQLPDGNVKVIGKSVVVYGENGELYHRFWDEPPTPDKVWARVKGGGGGGKPEGMERAVFEDYQKDQLCVWAPLDLVLRGSPDKSYEVRMEQKKHPLLGAPIKSDWK